MKDQNEFLMMRIQALEAEIKRLNNEIRKSKQCAFELTLSDPNLDKLINQIKVY